jgi:hypothetical protein
VIPPEPQEGEVPVLTEVVEEAPTSPTPPTDAAAHEALALELEAALLERLRPEIDRITGLALDRVRAELTLTVLKIVREAVAASLARASRGPTRN